MSRNFKEAPGGNGGSKFNAPELEPGAYPARLVGIVFLGVQKQRPFQGQAKPPIDEVRYTYELSHEFMQDDEGNDMEDKPRWFSEDMPVYGPEADKAKLTRRNKAIDPNDEADGDPTVLLGRSCSVTLVSNPGKGKHQGKVFTNVGDVSALGKMKGYVQPELVNPTFYFDPMDLNCTLEEFRKLPEFLQTKIKEADDYHKSQIKKLIEGAGDAEDSSYDEPDTDSSDAEGDDPY